MARSGTHETIIATHHDAFDAVIAALLARAAALGATFPPDDAERAVAQREGWVHVPTVELSALIHTAVTNSSSSAATRSGLPNWGTCPPGSASRRACGISAATARACTEGYDGIAVAPDHQGGHGQSAEVFAAEPHAGSEAAWGDQRTELGQVGLGRDRVPGAGDEGLEQVGVQDDGLRLAHRRHHLEQHPTARLHARAMTSPTPRVAARRSGSGTRPTGQGRDGAEHDQPADPLGVGEGVPGRPDAAAGGTDEHAVVEAQGVQHVADEADRVLAELSRPGRTPGR